MKPNTNDELKCYADKCKNKAKIAFVAKSGRYFRYCKECANKMDKQELFSRWRGWERKSL